MCNVFMYRGVILYSPIYNRNRSQPSLIPWCNGFLHNNGLIWSSSPHSHRCACICAAIWGQSCQLCLCVCVCVCVCVFMHQHVCPLKISYLWATSFTEDSQKLVPFVSYMCPFYYWYIQQDTELSDLILLTLY